MSQGSLADSGLSNESQCQSGSEGKRENGNVPALGREGQRNLSPCSNMILAHGRENLQHLGTTSATYAVVMNCPLVGET